LGYNGIHNSLVVVVVVPFAVPFLSSFFLAVLFLIFCAFGCVDGRFACFPALLQRGSATRQLRLVRRSLSLSHTQCRPSYCIVVTQVYIKYNSAYITVGELAIQCVCVCVLCVYILDMEVVRKERERGF
jgi:hypothetical protein